MFRSVQYDRHVFKSMGFSYFNSNRRNSNRYVVAILKFQFELRWKDTRRGPRLCSPVHLSTPHASLLSRRAVLGNDRYQGDCVNPQRRRARNYDLDLAGAARAGTEQFTTGCVQCIVLHLRHFSSDVCKRVDRAGFGPFGHFLRITRPRGTGLPKLFALTHGLQYVKFLGAIGTSACADVCGPRIDVSTYKTTYIIQCILYP